MADLFGFEAGLFITSSCMGNLMSSMIHCDRKGDAVIVGKNSHINMWERGNTSSIGNVYTKLVDNHSNGELDLDQLKELLEQSATGSVHYAKIRSIALESTQNYTGGKALSMEYLQKVYELK